jgi:multidrug efflux system outer membrane protein
LMIFKFTSTHLQKLIWLLCGLTAGCTVGPDYKGASMAVPTSYRYELKKNGKAAAQRENWWKIFGDSGLDRLESQVRADNFDLKAGLQRIEQSRALIRVAGADALPQVAATPYAQRASGTASAVTGSTKASNIFTVPLSVDWEMDLFGRIRRGIEAATAAAQATEEDYFGLRLALEAEAASGYFTLRALDREIQIVRDGVASRESSLKLAKDRLELGAVSGLDVAQAKGLLATSRAAVAELQRQRAAQEAALAVLAGRAASGFSIPVNPLSGIPPRVPAGMPAELLRARPDIRAAERQLAAENARVGVAVAAFYPSISLTGDLGIRATAISGLFDGGAEFWGIGPSVYIPIFQGGRNQAELNRSRASYEEVLAIYQKTVVSALAEVETSLSATRFYSQQSAYQRQTVEAAVEARDIAKDQYEGGTASYLSVLDAERTALDAQRQQSVLTGAEYLNAVALIRALGGRW